MSGILDRETDEVASTVLPQRYRQARRSAVGSTLRRRRLDRWLSRDELAGLIGVAGSYIAAVEEDQLMPTLDTLFALADALDAAPADLLRDAEDEAQSALLRDLHSRLGDPST